MMDKTKRLLDIVVTHYKEPWHVVRPLFDMLNAQKHVDFKQFKVWVVQDGPAANLIPRGYFAGSPLQYEIVTIPHKGVSAARNAGLDKADSEWICFCDCDDCFTFIFSLKWLFYILKPDAPYDMMWNEFYMNYFDKDQTLIRQNEYNHVWIHNKYYRLSFLREHDIRFCEELYMSEDSAFNNVVEMEIPEGRIGHINTTEPLYSWCRREDSVTMNRDNYYRNVEGHFKRNLYVLSEYRKRNHVRTGLVVARTITDAYSFLTKYPNNFDAERIAEMVGKFYLENKDIYDGLPEEGKKLALEASEKEASNTGEVILGRPTVEEWLERAVKGVRTH